MIQFVHPAALGLKPNAEGPRPESPRIARRRDGLPLRPTEPQDKTIAPLSINAQPGETWEIKATLTRGILPTPKAAVESMNPVLEPHGMEVTSVTEQGNSLSFNVMFHQAMDINLPPHLHTFNLSLSYDAATKVA